MLQTVDPRTGERRAAGVSATTLAEVNVKAGLAATAAARLRATPRAWRSAFLRTVADHITRRREHLVAAASAETGLGAARLDQEVERAAGQFRLFADVVDDGGYLEVMVDHSDEGSPGGRRPEIRRMLVPLGPVAVFGSSNFPFAFSVLGGDSASALAAGNPIIVKAHSSHLLVSQVSFDILRVAAEEAGAPSGTVGIVYGQEAGVALVAHPVTRAVGFTGSRSAAESLLHTIAQRDEPIPFYGELSSVNPLIVSPGAARARPHAIAKGLVESVTQSGGQLCTKPGIVFAPADAVEFISAVREGIAAQPSAVLLNERVATGFAAAAHALEHASGEVIAKGGAPEGGFSAAPLVLSVPARHFSEAVAQEAFGPLVVLVTYEHLDDIGSALTAVPNSLTASIHSEAEEADLRRSLLAAVEDRVGRIVFNGFPTGVRVCWSQHHGGPWPATNAIHTSVGATSIRRFLRPLVWQDAPEDVLPDELRESSTVPRRVDSVLVIG